jgi:hypothetical protein
MLVMSTEELANSKVSLKEATWLTNKSGSSSNYKALISYDVIRVKKNVRIFFLNSMPSLKKAYSSTRY